MNPLFFFGTVEGFRGVWVNCKLQTRALQTEQERMSAKLGYSCKLRTWKVRIWSVESIWMGSFTSFTFGWWVRSYITHCEQPKPNTPKQNCTLHIPWLRMGLANLVPSIPFSVFTSGVHPTLPSVPTKSHHIWTPYFAPRSPQPQTAKISLTPRNSPTKWNHTKQYT